MGCSSARAKASRESALSRTSSEYVRASWEYQNSSGLTAVSSAAISPTRSEATRRPSPHMTGTAVGPHRARLVEPEALLVQRREADRSADRNDRTEQPERAPAVELDAAGAVRCR